MDRDTSRRQQARRVRAAGRSLSCFSPGFNKMTWGTRRRLERTVWEQMETRGWSRGSDATASAAARWCESRNLTYVLEKLADGRYVVTKKENRP